MVFLIVVIVLAPFYGLYMSFYCRKLKREIEAMKNEGNTWKKKYEREYYKEKSQRKV